MQATQQTQGDIKAHPHHMLGWAKNSSEVYKSHMQYFFTECMLKYF